MATPYAPIPTLSEIQERGFDAFGRHACLWQALCQQQQCFNMKHLIVISPTGSGKTLMFLLRLLFNGGGIIIIITPLTILGHQQEGEINLFGFPAVAMNATNATDEVIKKIEGGEFRVAVFSPEFARSPRGKTLLCSSRLSPLLDRVVFDEAHCISEWGDTFRADYAEIGEILWLLPPHVKFVMTTATMNQAVLNDTMTKLHLRKSTTDIIWRDPDRPNIAYAVRKMKYTAKSFQDAAFLVPLDLKEGDRPVPFLAFTNSKRATEDLAGFLRNRLADHLKSKIVWFHAGMTQEFRQHQISRLKREELWGIVCTDALGMGLDIDTIRLVIQWKAPRSMACMIQRAGRGGRNLETQATFILIAEKTRFLDEQEKTRLRRVARVAKDIGKRRLDHTSQVSAPGRLSKRRAVSGVDGVPRAMGLDQDEGEEWTDVEMRDAQGASEPSEGDHESGREDNDAHGFRPGARQPNQGYAARAGRGKGKKKTGQAAVTAHKEAVDRFINAHSPGRESCRREVLRREARLDLWGIHPELGMYCCSRCLIRAPTTCCDICNPEHFVQFDLDPSEPISRAPRKRNTTKVDVTARAQQHPRLRQALDDWRELKSSVRFGENDFYGSAALLPDVTLDKIVALGVLRALVSADDLAYETNWCYAREYAAELLMIIHQQCPLPVLSGPFSTGPLNPLTQNSQVSRRMRAPTKCGACGELGHNRKNRNCRLFENVNPSMRPRSPTHGVPASPPTTPRRPRTFSPSHPRTSPFARHVQENQPSPIIPPLVWPQPHVAMGVSHR